MSKTRPSYIPPKTLQQAKNDYKKNGPRISTQQSRQTARGVELYERAERLKAAEKRRKQNAIKKASKEEREREARRRMGIPSPMKEGKKVAASQKLLFGFIKVVGVKEEKSVNKQEEKNLEPEQELEALEALEELVACSDHEELGSEEEYMDDALDDTSLLEAVVEKCSSNTIECVNVDLPHSRPAKRRRLQKTTSIQATTSFNSNDFILAREIAWTQDIEATKTEAFTNQSKETRPEAKDTTIDFKQGTSHNDVWDEFLLSNTQLEREIAVTPPVVKSLTNVVPPTASDLMIYPASSDSFSTLPDSPGLGINTNICTRNTGDDPFLSLLSTQDLGFDFSSPETSHRACITDDRVISSVDDIVSSPIISGQPEPPPQHQHIIVLPTSHPDIAAPCRKALSSVTSMPPPPLPSRLHAIKPPAQVQTSARQSESHTTFLPKPPQKVSWTTRACPKPYKPAAFLKPALPIFSQHKRNGCSGQGAGVEWIPFDFDLSTQDCREIGV